MIEPRVMSGHIVALRLYDVANGIDLQKADSLWTRRAAGRTARPRLSTTPAKAVAFGVPPLEIARDPISLALDGAPMDAVVSARLYEFGALSIALRVQAGDLPWSAFVDRMNAVGRAVAPASAGALWAGLLADFRGVLADAFDRPLPSAIEEDYLIATVQAFDAPLTAAELIASVDLVPLLSGEQRALSDAARADVLRQRFSYYTDDLVVLGWDRAFILEPRGDSDVADVIEVANAQLLEMRYYDELLDDELPRMYDLVENARRGINIFASRRYATLAGRLYTVVAEVTELTEKVDNALQVTEDVYLARIYAAAVDLFRIPLVTEAVNRKLAIIRDTYAALYDKASAARTEVMEIAVIALILLEVVLAAFGH